MHVIYSIYNVMINSLCDVNNFFENNLYFNKTFYVTTENIYVEIEYFMVYPEITCLR